MLYTADAARAAPDTVMRSMFEARKQVFIDLLKWDLPVLAGRFEVDQFDGPRARYLIITDQAQRHLASARLLPSTRPHILGTLFPGLCEEALPSGPDTYEITRFCLGRGLGAQRRRQVRDTLVLALAEHALETGIRVYTGVAEPAWLQQILAFGWACRPLGPPRSIGGRILGALRIDIAPDTRTLLAQAGIGADAQAEAA